VANIPFPYRAAVAIALVFALRFYSRAKPSKHQIRTKELLFLTLVAILATLYGVVNDCFTAKISPEYFSLGKGLPNDQHLYYRSLIIGAQAGFCAGIVLGCIFLILRTYLFPSATFKRIIYSLALPIGLGIVCSIVFPLCFGHLDPIHVARDLDYMLSKQQIDAFNFVWFEHLGVYTGTTVGTILAIIYHWKTNRSAKQ